MAKKEKETKEFFEVFRKPQEHKAIKYTSDRFQQNKVVPTVFPVSTSRRNKEIEEKKPLGWIKDTVSDELSEPITHKTKWPFRKTVVPLKQETLIIFAVGATLLALSCFFTGYKIGKSSALTPEISEGSVAQPEKEGDVNPVPPNKVIGTVDLTNKPIDVVNEEEQNTKWTLQIISYSNNKKNMKLATNLAKAIKNMTGHSTFVAKRGSELVVCAGRFNSRKSAETKQALNEITNLEYEGKKQFASSYLIQIK